jgi:hypothetical protein
VLRLAYNGFKRGKIGEVGPPAWPGCLLHLGLFALRTQRILLCEAKVAAVGTGQLMEAEPTGKGSAPTKVWCQPEGRRGVKAGAGAAGLSVSVYLRRAGMSTEVRGAPTTSGS